MDKKLFLFKFAVVNTADNALKYRTSVPANSLDEAAAIARQNLVCGEEIQLSCVAEND